jgi:hypothetical protein
MQVFFVYHQQFIKKKCHLYVSEYSQPTKNTFTLP